MSLALRGFTLVRPGRTRLQPGGTKPDDLTGRLPQVCSPAPIYRKFCFWPSATQARKVSFAIAIEKRMKQACEKLGDGDAPETTTREASLRSVSGKAAGQAGKKLAMVTPFTRTTRKASLTNASGKEAGQACEKSSSERKSTPLTTRP